MILKSKEIREACNVIKNAIDTSAVSQLTATLELKTVGTDLFLNVTNKEYYASVKFAVGNVDPFHATVEANKFVKLVSSTTTEDIELGINGNALTIKGNGKYTLPMIFDNAELLALPEINMQNVTLSFDIPRVILDNIATHNSKEFDKGTFQKAVQKYYYVDQTGCVTFTTGACVYNFNLPQPVSMFLPQKLVKLFKLLKSDTVKFSMAQDDNGSGLIQTKARFEAGNTVITSFLPNEQTLFNDIAQVAPKIRNRANKSYDYSVNLNRNALFDTINRLAIFNDGTTLKNYSTLEFGENSVVIWDVNKESSEELPYNNTSNIEEMYTAVLDLNDLAKTLATWNDGFVNIHFGDHQAVILSQPNIATVIPECLEV